MIKSTIDVVVFDMDMTLCYPVRDFSDVFEAVFEAPFEDVSATWLKSVTLDKPCTGFEAVKASFPQLTEHELKEKFFAISNQWAASQRLYHGVESFIDKLRGAYGCKVGIMTNGPSYFQRSIIDRLGLTDIVDFNYASGDEAIGMRKPNLKLIKLLEKLQNVDPSKAVFIGDSWKKDLEPAAKAGWRTLRVKPSNGLQPSVSVLEVLERNYGDEGIAINYSEVEI